MRKVGISAHKKEIPMLRIRIAAAVLAASITAHFTTAEVPTLPEAVKQQANIERVVFLPIAPISGLVIDTIIEEITKWVLREAMRRAFCAALHQAHQKTVTSETLKQGTLVRIDEAIAELNKAADCHPLSPLPRKPN